MARASQQMFRGFDPIHRGYADARGLAELRRAICDYLGAARGVRASPEQIIITSGTQHAIDIAVPGCSFRRATRSGSRIPVTR